MALAPCLLSPRWPCFRMGTCRGSSNYWAQSTVAGLSVCTGSGEGSARGLCEKSKSDPTPCPMSSGGWASRAERVCGQKVMGLGEIIFGKSNGNRMMKASLQLFGQQAQSREAGHGQKPFRTTLQGLGCSLQWQVSAPQTWLSLCTAPSLQSPYSASLSPC